MRLSAPILRAVNNRHTKARIMTPPHAPPGWIWLPDADTREPRRIDRILFRRTFSLHSCPDVASIHLSARLHYHLRVNGRLVGVGPARTYPDFHEFDTHAVADLLSTGENTIDVDVLHWNLTTFHRLLETPGFIAWGEIRVAHDAVIALDTPGDWRCLRHAGVDATAPRLSFAQGPVEIVDTRPMAGLAATACQTPAPAAADPTPRLRARAIPPMTQIPIAAATATVATVNEDEQVFGGGTTFDGIDKTNAYPPGDSQLVMGAWIFSPTNQIVPAGLWWGEYRINGTRCETGPDDRIPLRNTARLNLRKGWNKLLATQQLAFGYAEFCLAVPRNARLTVKTKPSHAAPDGVLLADVFCPDTFSRLSPEWDKPDGPLPDLKWRLAPGDGPPPSPLRHIAWARPATPSPATLPITLAPGASHLVTLDLGRLVLGRPAFEIDAPSGTCLDVGHAEEAQNGRPRLDKAVVVYGADRWIASGGKQTLESFSPRGFRYLDVLISGHTEPVTLSAAGVIEQRYPHVFSGSFACSDNAFNRLWAFGVRTLELCSEDVYTDCPWRERTLYGGDLLPELATTAVLTRDFRLVRHSLEVLLQSLSPAGWLQSRAPSPRNAGTLYDYPLLAAIATDWYVRLTRDTDFAVRAWPVFQSMARCVSDWERVDGLYAPPIAAFIDHGRKPSHRATAPFNAALAAAFHAWAAIGRLAGADDEAAALRALGDALDEALTKACFDAAAGTFRDVPTRTGPAQTEGTPANTWPLLFCASAQPHAPAVLRAIARTLEAYDPNHASDSVSPYQLFYLLSALSRHNCAELAETTIRRVYGPMLDNPTGTLWEHGHSGNSLVHAWSTGVNTYLATTVLGVRMGFQDPDALTHICIAPCAASITWARGSVPHPLGTVSVSWARRADGLHIAVEAPDGVPISITPAGPLADLPCHVTQTPKTVSR